MLIILIETKELGQRFGGDFNILHIENAGQSVMISDFVQKVHEARSPGTPEPNGDNNP